MVREFRTRSAQRAAVRPGEVALDHVARKQHQTAELVHLFGLEVGGDALLLVARFARL